MLNIDPRSIVLMTPFISVFCLVVLLIMCHSFPRSIGGLKEWACACAMAMLSSSLLFARGHIPPVLSVVLGNVLIAGIFLMMRASIRRFSGQAVDYRWTACALAALAGLWVWAAYFLDYHEGILLCSLTNSLLLASGAFAVTRIKPRSAACWLSLATFTAASLLMASRFLTTLLGLDVPSNLFDTSWIHKTYLLTYPLTYLATTLAFILMAGDKLRGLLLDMNRTLEDAVAERTLDLQQQINRARELEREVANIAESERRRIGRELHDDLGQQLTGISLSAEALADAVKGVAPDMASLADAMERASSEAIVKVRRIAHGLMPVDPGSDGLSGALTRLASSVSTLSGVACAFDYEEPVGVDDENVAANLFRIAQEAVNNAVKHAGATRVLMRLDEVDGKLSMSISDNGSGIETGAKPGGARGMGLGIMEFRASVIGFLLSIGSAPGQGTTIRVTAC